MGLEQRSTLSTSNGNIGNGFGNSRSKNQFLVEESKGELAQKRRMFPSRFLLGLVASTALVLLGGFVAVAPTRPKKVAAEDLSIRAHDNVAARNTNHGGGAGGAGGGNNRQTTRGSKKEEENGVGSNNKESGGDNGVETAGGGTNKKEERTATKSDNSKTTIGKDKDWKWFDGDLNAYYNSLERQIHDRNPAKISSYAVHRWMGPKRSTEEHYELIDRAVAQHHHHHPGSPPLRVFDAGCGLGSALMFFEARHPSDWDMTGHTISEEQHRFIESRLPRHNFRVNLRSYDEIDGDDHHHHNNANNKEGNNNGSKGQQHSSFDVIYSIEALIHSMDVRKTMKEWADHLAPGGIIVVIDDYVSESVTDKEGDEEIQAFSKSWLANVLITPSEFEALANGLGLTMVENRDLLTEYEIVKRNYRNQKPDIKPYADRDHQGWMGSKLRQRLTVDGKLSYNMIVLKKTK